mmetsp:Transcript_19950/g.58252  ORF Transcript_19950/g.58252 Transcript_19950/m.58252 type:complete len:219 (-) Transcript_19950:1410-2066(-)
MASSAAAAPSSMAKTTLRMVDEIECTGPTRCFLIRSMMRSLAPDSANSRRKASEPSGDRIPPAPSRICASSSSSRTFTSQLSVGACIRAVRWSRRMFCRPSRATVTMSTGSSGSRSSHSGAITPKFTSFSVCSGQGDVVTFTSAKTASFRTARFEAPRRRMRGRTAPASITSWICSLLPAVTFDMAQAARRWTSSSIDERSRMSLGRAPPSRAAWAWD